MALARNDNLKFLKVGRIAAVVLDTKAGKQPVKLTAGVDYFDTEDSGSSFTGRRDGTGLDAQLTYGPAVIQAEWLQNQKHPATGLPTTREGWSVLGVYNLTPKWQGMVRYDSNKAKTNNTTNEWTYGLSYLLKGDDLKLSFNYISSQQPAPLPHGDLFLTRVQVVF